MSVGDEGSLLADAAVPMPEPKGTPTLTPAPTLLPELDDNESTEPDSEVHSAP